MPDYSEQDYLEGCKRQDRAVQEHLYRTYYSPLLKVCARYARDMHDAENLINDAFLRIFTKIDQYDGRGSFEGWMRKVTVNTCLDYLRSRDLKTALNMRIGSNVISDDYAVEVSESALSKLHFKVLLNLIQTLPPMSRTVFNLFVFEGHTHRQISNLLDISEGTSHWHVAQARKLLQQKINALNETTPAHARK